MTTEGFLGLAARSFTPTACPSADTDLTVQLPILLGMPVFLPLLLLTGLLINDLDIQARSKVSSGMHQLCSHHQ